MPSIDLSDVVLDPEISSEVFKVVRRVSVTDANGRVVVTPTFLPAIGQPDITGGVTPVGDNSLLREQAFQTQQNAIQIVTTFRLRAASKDAGVEYQPDLVQWPPDTGTYYLVHTVNDWTSYGAGFIVAECIQFDWTDKPPAE